MRANENQTQPPHKGNWLLVGYLILAGALFVGLTFAVEGAPYFDLDLQITRAVQSLRSPALDPFMEFLGQLGYFPQTLIPNGLIILFFIVRRLKWETVALVFDGAGIAVFGTLLRMTINRARPTPDLVFVPHQIENGRFGYPSGHAMGFIAIFGFVIFLTFVLLKPSWWRTLLALALTILIVLVCISRIYVGEHWASDIVGGYLFSSLWLSVTILFYNWGKPRFFISTR